MGGLRGVLRGLPVLTGRAPQFDPARAPADPVALFTDWLLHAIEAGVAEPHAMTVSTADAAGRPSGRVLILKDVDDGGWHFAVNAVSQKGRELAGNPAAALTFYWPALGRQVRVSGVVSADPPAVTAADFLARPVGSRAMALTRRQSAPYTDPAELDAALDKAHLELARTPSLVPDEWVSYAVAADAVEFWQADPQRRHQRLRYERARAGWSRILVWP
ncbi:pyridoxine/pyridoxamine 5'-phosphate oxidase [Mycobacterium talmoniae]|uniref:Pyridoxamine 5'-phosphate oxidase n=1 Tax=Mycobacterium talmoniae TaxID=1858794 RepID=A0A1S1MZL7_9MYCO|nr:MULTISPECIES: pyridoxal 5'-phosphate synthase [Mycobacterium]OHU92539.1 pyridoxamine 5'-phosphate oxidase [Mycobacterium talmoniae]TDH46243.1 pyridoxamine 5'-phosphate oxidase [Mycobacterium eburneum]